jgi:rubrerythrin
MQEFEVLKEKLAKKFNDENIKELGSPSEVYDYIASLNTEKEQGEKHAPYGKATLTSTATGGEQFNSKTEMLDKLYDVAYVNSSKYDKAQVAEAKQKIETLLTSLIESDSYAQLRDPQNLSMVEHKAKIMACPKCGFTLLNTEVCPNCGEDWSREGTKRRKTMRTWTFKPYDNRSR